MATWTALVGECVDLDKMPVAIVFGTTGSLGVTMKGRAHES